ncbi:MAG: ATP-binding protein [Proteobacteria bacterium]|nr:ATP-binding protein [Pseudomonadota bacterium]
MSNQDFLRVLQRIAQGIEALAPPQPPRIDIKNADAYVWDAEKKDLIPILETQHLDLKLLKGIEQQSGLLLTNTLQFARGHSANNALLWGARGMGKSSLVKAVHAEANRQMPRSLVLIEIHREDIHSLPYLMRALSGWVVRRFVLFCDDLSFDAGDATYKSLKAALEGGIEGRPDHILFYATSNRRHLLPRDMLENEQQTAVHPGDAVEEKVSLSDRFGLWLGFHHCDQNTYLAMVKGYIEHYKLPASWDEIEPKALEWSRTRGARSGRVAWQFVQDLAGKLGKKIR